MARSLDLIVSFNKNSTASDGELAYQTLVNHLTESGVGRYAQLQASLYDLDSNTVRITSSAGGAGGYAAMGVIATPQTPPPHPPKMPAGNVEMNTAVRASHGTGNIKNYSQTKQLVSLEDLKSTLMSVASGTGFF